LKFSAKNGHFLVLNGKKQISPLLPPPGKIMEKFPIAPPLEKILPTPMVLTTTKAYANVLGAQARFSATQNLFPS